MYTNSQWLKSLIIVAVAAVAVPVVSFASDADLDEDYVVSPEEAARKKEKVAKEDAEQGETAWDKLVYKVYKDGERADMPEYDNYYLKSGTSFDTSVDREVRYLTLAVRKDASERFFPVELFSVSEKWTRLENDYFKVEQIIRYVNLQGQMTQVYESSFTLSPRAHVGDHQIIRSTTNLNEDDRAQWEKLKADWIAEFPTGS